MEKTTANTICTATQRTPNRFLNLLSIEGCLMIKEIRNSGNVITTITRNTTEKRCNVHIKTECLLMVSFSISSGLTVLRKEKKKMIMLFVIRHMK